MRRVTLVTASALVAVALWSGSASAVPPTRQSVDDTFSFVESSFCPFPVLIEGRNVARLLLFRDRSGQLTHINIHGTEELTYSANGSTLVAEPFPYNFHLVFGSDGQLEHQYVTGLVLRVPLPDGTMFLSAGRLDFEDIEEGFAVRPQVGKSGDVEALCAALS